ncbi:hypothetical protein L209DRAFT_72145 [Thermothelomyces heterothallicus CBS 203.75]
MRKPRFARAFQPPSGPKVRWGPMRIQNRKEHHFAHALLLANARPKRYPACQKKPEADETTYSYCYFCSRPPSEFIAVTSWGGWRIMRHVLLPRLWTRALQSVQARRSASSPRAPLSTLRWMEVSAKPGPWRLTLVSIQPFCSQSHIILSRHETSPDRAGLQPTAHSWPNTWGGGQVETGPVFSKTTLRRRAAKPLKL